MYPINKGEPLLIGYLRSTPPPPAVFAPLFQSAHEFGLFCPPCPYHWVMSVAQRISHLIQLTGTYFFTQFS